MHLFTVLNKIFQGTKEVDNCIDSNSRKESKIIPQNEIKLNNNIEQIKDKNTCYALYPKDGDTFVGMHENEKKTFRLAGINTPEKDQPWSKEATEFLREKISKKVIFIEILGKDKYERNVVEVYLDKELKQHVNKMLIEKGFATSERYSLNGENTHSIFEYIANETIELKAKIKDNGMWDEETLDSNVENKKNNSKLKM